MSESENDLRYALDAANRALEWQCKKIKQLMSERDESLRWEEKYREQIRDSRGHRHHEAVMMFANWRLSQPEPMTGGALAEWAHLMADYLYPPPDAVFDPPLRHHRNPPPKAEGT